MCEVRKKKMHDGTNYLAQKLRERIFLKRTVVSPIILSMFTFHFKKKKKLNVTKSYKTVLVLKVIIFSLLKCINKSGS